MDSKFIAKCVELNELGQGIVYYDNNKIIVDNILINEEAEIIITKKTHLYYLGRVHRLIKESSNRNHIKCNHKCGGCNLIHLNYPLQLEYKNRQTKEFLDDFNVLNILKANDNYHYRNKVIYALKYTNNNVFFGLYEENTHRVIETNDCLVNNIKSNVILTKIKEYILNNNIKSIRYILMRFSSLNELLLGLITNEELTNEEELVKLLKDDVNSIIINYNDFTTNKILTNNNKIIYGNNIIKEKIENYYFNISLNSFFQINYSQMLNMYKLIKNSSLLTKDDILLDAYSGISTIGIYLSDAVKKVISVESNKSSYLNALENAKINNIKNITCINEDCTEYIKNSHESFNVVVMDPPRSGCSKEFLTSIINRQVEKLIYVSCNIKSLKRDLNILKEFYNILEIQPIDMFPNTMHVETLVSLHLKTCQSQK